MTLVRDATLLLAFALLFFAPQDSAAFLRARGFTTIPTPLGNIDLKAIGGDAGSAEHLITDALDVLPESAAKEQLKKALAQLDSLNTSVKTQLAATETPEVPVVPKPSAPTADAIQVPTQNFGWMFSGRVDKDKHAWVPNTHRTVAESFPLDGTATISDDVYLRADSSGHDHANGAVLGVLKVGQKIHVSGQDFTAALAGGFFVWVKVPLAG